MIPTKGRDSITQVKLYGAIYFVQVYIHIYLHTFTPNCRLMHIHIQLGSGAEEKIPMSVVNLGNRGSKMIMILGSDWLFRTVN